LDAGVVTTNTKQKKTACTVCKTTDVELFENIDGQDYFRCPRCMATFLDPAHWAAPDFERARYAEHQNAWDDPGYRKFLSRLAIPLLEKLPPNSKGIDFGCGPGPVLAKMLEQARHSVRLYDPYFFPDAALLDQQYDFIACTETIEHFFHPAKEFARFDTMLLPGGHLGLMTCFQTDDAAFAGWHYRRDATHVVFYREQTLRFIAKSLGWGIEIPTKDVAILQKPKS
jgi:hypothetical protein